jgi:hypothetical protein
MKKVIVLWGTANIGKTITLKKVHKQLLKLSTNTLPEHSRNNIDIREILIINGMKVGIETQGDPNSRLAESLKLFKKQGCVLIICATRTRGQTVELVNELEPKYSVSWRGQSAVSSTEWQKQSNSAIAKLIVNEAKSIIYE